MSKYNIKYNFKARLNVACNITEKNCFSWNKKKNLPKTKQKQQTYRLISISTMTLNPP